MIHTLGGISLRLRVEVRSRADNHATITMTSRAVIWLRDEFTPCSEHSPTTLICKKESYLFLFLSWCTSTLTVLHITYGVLMFSSLLFISVQDAVSVVGRYFISAIVCRAIVAFELAGMRKASTAKDLVYPRGIDERYGLELSSVLAERKEPLRIQSLQTVFDMLGNCFSMPYLQSESCFIQPYIRRQTI